MITDGKSCIECAYMIGTLCRLHGNRIKLEDQEERTCDHWFNRDIEEDTWCDLDEEKSVKGHRLA